MSRFGLDYAWCTISPAGHRSVGSTFACRYLSHDPSKDLSAGEYQTLKAGGIDVVVVWETTAARAGAGRAAGAQDAADALAKALAIGMPAGRPIYFAVDFDASVGTVEPYFRGVNQVLGVARTGAYAGVRVIAGLFDARLITYGWQTYAWSSGRLDSRAQLYQYSNNHRVEGKDCDYDRALAADFGQWGFASPPIPPPPTGEQPMAITAILNHDGRPEVYVETQPSGPGKAGEVFALWKVAKPDGSIAWNVDASGNPIWKTLGTPQ